MVHFFVTLIPAKYQGPDRVQFINKLDCVSLAAPMHLKTMVCGTQVFSLSLESAVDSDTLSSSSSITVSSIYPHTVCNAHNLYYTLSLDSLCGRLSMECPFCSF